MQFDISNAVHLCDNTNCSYVINDKQRAKTFLIFILCSAFLKHGHARLCT